VYGRWQPRRDAFEKWLSVFIDFLGVNGLGSLSPIQCEVSYVNHVISGNLWHRHGELHRFLRLSGEPEGGFLPTPEQAQLATQYVIADEAENPIGRMHVSAQPGYLTGSNVPMYVLTLTARGKPEGDGLPGILRFLDRGREWIVKGFVDMTTEAAHKEWGLNA
jgi:hypothetical protein